MEEKFVYNVCYVDSYEDIWRVEESFSTLEEAEAYLEDRLNDFDDTIKEEMRSYFEIEKQPATAVYVVTNNGLTEGIYSSEERAKEACGNDPDKQIVKWYVDFAHKEDVNV